MSKREIIDLLAALAFIAMIVTAVNKTASDPVKYPASKEEAQAAAARDGKSYFIYEWQIFRADGSHLGPVF